MSLGVGQLLAAIAVGIGATALMDLWNTLLKQAFGVRSLDYCMLGRWLRHMPRGTFRHASIASASPMRGECAAGWLAHYSIGVTFAIALVAVTAGSWLARPTLPPALAFGLGTIVFPFFVLQPAVGLGVASSRAPRPMLARIKSVATHAVFGIGLYLCGLVVSRLVRA